MSPGIESVRGRISNRGWRGLRRELRSIKQVVAADEHVLDVQQSEAVLGNARVLLVATAQRILVGKRDGGRAIPYSAVAKFERTGDRALPRVDLHLESGEVVDLGTHTLESAARIADWRSPDQVEESKRHASNLYLAKQRGAEPSAKQRAVGSSDRKATRKAAELAELYGIDLGAIEKRGVITEKDVEESRQRAITAAGSEAGKKKAAVSSDPSTWAARRRLADANPQRQFEYRWEMWLGSRGFLGPGSVGDISSFNELGRKGWELVAMYDRVVLFKRELPPLELRTPTPAEPLSSEIASDSSAAPTVDKELDPPTRSTSS